MEGWSPVGSFMPLNSCPQGRQPDSLFFSLYTQSWSERDSTVVPFCWDVLWNCRIKAIRPIGQGLKPPKQWAKQVSLLGKLITSDILLQCLKPDKHTVNYVQTLLYFSLKGKSTCQNLLFRFSLASAWSASTPNIPGLILSACSIIPYYKHGHDKYYVVFYILVPRFMFFTLINYIFLLFFLVIYLMGFVSSHHVFKVDRRILCYSSFFLAMIYLDSQILGCIFITIKFFIVGLHPSLHSSSIIFYPQVRKAGSMWHCSLVALFSDYFCGAFLLH